MDPPYTLLYRPEVVEEDLPRIPQNLRTRIVRAIEARLMTEPARYGERLRRSLSGLWKIRVGDYRICYEIEAQAVTVWAIRHRRDVYSILERRRG
ncbi:MAG: type II toxin-antitoxin system RelE/ParE family toxin [Armatimonadota bacterium]|nr:type II toxin-antitoxin system RelE/ParE family toxin [Armatimonadota bacterium]